MSRFKIAVEVLNLLLKEGDFVTTSELQNRLFDLGILDSKHPRSSDRRKLNRVLSFLESEGFIESESIEVKGRKPQRWRVNYRALPYMASISDEELVSLLTFATFVPEAYRNLPVFTPFLQLLCRLSRRIDSDKKSLIENSFVYESQFLEKFVDFDEKLLLQVYSAVIEGKALRVKYKNSDAFKIYPIRIFVYNGVIYVGAVREDKEYRAYYLAGLKVLERLEEMLPTYYRKKYEDVTFSFEEEKPFLFGARIAPKEGMDYFSSPQIFPTQFFFKKEEESYLIYLVGFSGSRFTSRFLVEEVLEILPPSEEIIAKAKDLRLRSKYVKLSYSLKENNRRFNIFVRDLERFLMQRQTTLKGLQSKNF